MLSSVPGWKLFTIWHRNKYFKKVGNMQKKKKSTCFIITLFTTVFLQWYRVLCLNWTALYSSKHVAACNCS